MPPNILYDETLEAEPAEGIPTSKFGTSCTLMKLWEVVGDSYTSCWATEPPEIESEEKSSSESPEHAITLLYRDRRKTGKHTLDTIIMRSPELQTLLEDTIPEISSFYNEVEHGISIRSPFRLLYWYFEYIDAAASSQEDEKLSQVATLLLGVLREEFRDILAKQTELLARREMNFNTVWTIFKPGLACLTLYSGNIIAVKVSSVEFRNTSMGIPLYRINYKTIGWDGEYFGWQDYHADIFEFSGRRKINDLEIFPAEFYKDSNIISQLTARGKRFVEIALREPCMMSFNGEALDDEDSPMWWQSEQKKKLSERVVLDARAYNHYSRRLYVGTWMKRDEMSKALRDDKTDQTIFLYCCTEFYSFALRQKNWAKVWIDQLEEVAFNESAYPSLVLPNNYKELLLAFAEAQIGGYGFDDVIAGKGQGILMLLAGPPGTGKTLTAEAMAEHMRRPLYAVSAGELGASVRGMENELDRVLELSTRWNAVLLLDEADVFLERRTDSDLQRNTIVSVFLRKLEYYRGIMFLTTNRIGSFDEAFKSRIHVAIRYPELETSARHLIWSNFIKKTRDFHPHGVQISAEEIDELSQKSLNGREIRNIVKSGQLLAVRSKQPLQKSHLDTVWKVEHEDSPWQTSH